MNSIAIFGGAFDPIHYGHLRTSINIQRAFHFDSYRFLPCNIPVLKSTTQASNEQRVHMIELALHELTQENPWLNFSIDVREINRPGPSYTVDTLKSIRAEFPKAAITLVLGYDAYQALPQWHQWQQLNNFAHLLVIHRGTHTPLRGSASDRYPLLKTQKAGCICEFDAGSFMISSTEIRTTLQKKYDLSDQIPATVYNYIKEQELYQ